PLPFDFARTGHDWQAVAMPRPMVISSSQSGSDVTVTVVLDPPMTAFNAPVVDGFVATDTITHYQIVSYTTPSVDPGREGGLWTDVGAPLPTTSPAGTATFPCPRFNSVYLATKLIVDGF